MALDAGQLSKMMITAARGQLKKKWPLVREYAESEARKTAETIAMIEKLHASDKISEEEAQLLLQMQRNSANAVLLTVKGMGLLAAEQAINAAVDAVRTVVNEAVGFALI
ncbi:MAG TPA: hypothetical protein VFS24_14440 [Steroidobacteraceae bacterium]|nr:hypothetical protein [Steroidobacteraceae bacterium]